MNYDLHTHTNASDGTLTPRELVETAAAIGLAGISVTDHDTVAGVAEARAVGEQCGILVVPGIEINTEYDGKEVHVLGYYVDVDNPPFLQQLIDLQRARESRMVRMVNQLRESGVPITEEDVLHEAQDAVAFGRPHVARALVRIGYAKTVGEAFQQFLLPGRPGFVERSKLTPTEAVDMIRRAGGVPVLAHPALVRDDGLLFRLIDAGLSGVEVYHPDNQLDQQKHYASIARSRSLIGTGGSDFHGASAGHRADLGAWTVSQSVVRSLAAASGNK